MRNASILLLLTFISLSLPAETPDAPGAADYIDPLVNGVAIARRDGEAQIRPKHQKIWLIAGFTLDATARTLDAYSTHRALKQKDNQEMLLPNTIVKSQPALYGYGASILLTEYLGYRFLTAHHHEKIARWLPYIDSALVFPFAAHNLTLIHGATAGRSNGPVIGIQAR